MLHIIWLHLYNFLEIIKMASQVVLVVKNLPANAGVIRDAGLIPGSARSHGGNGNPPQYPCLENPMDRRQVGDSPWTEGTACTCRQGMVVGGWWVRLPKVRKSGPGSHGNAPYLDCIHFSIPVVILYSSFARCYNWEEVGKVYMVSLSQLHLNL